MRSRRLERIRTNGIMLAMLASSITTITLLMINEDIAVPSTIFLFASSMYLAFIPPGSNLHLEKAKWCIKSRFVAMIVVFITGILLSTIPHDAWVATAPGSPVLPPVLWMGILPAVVSIGFLIFMKVLPFFDTWDVTEPYPQDGMENGHWNLSLVSCFSRLPHRVESNLATRNAGH